MRFSGKLASFGLTAKQITTAISPLLSVRTVEDWLQHRRTPPEYLHVILLDRVKKYSRRHRP